MALDTYGMLQQSERRGVLGKYSKLRQGLEKGFRRRGITRSGFAPEKLGELGAEEQGALGDVEAGLTDKLMNYKFQQQQLELMKKMSEQQESDDDSGWLGDILGFAGPVVGGLLGLL